jgi:hypothetical protein
MSFLVKERLTHREKIKDLTLSDLVYMIDKLLPQRAHDRKSITEIIAKRHHRRRQARESAYRRHKAAYA